MQNELRLSGSGMYYSHGLEGAAEIAYPASVRVVNENRADANRLFGRPARPHNFFTVHTAEKLIDEVLGGTAVAAGSILTLGNSNPRREGAGAVSGGDAGAVVLTHNASLRGGAAISGSASAAVQLTMPARATGNSRASCFGAEVRLPNKFSPILIIPAPAQPVTCCRTYLPRSCRARALW